jgi:ribosomal protein S8
MKGYTVIMPAGTPSYSYIGYFETNDKLVICARTLVKESELGVYKGVEKFKEYAKDNEVLLFYTSQTVMGDNLKILHKAKSLVLQFKLEQAGLLPHSTDT